MNLELLAPAGELNTFKAVIDAGADAVYFGGELFSARAYAKNFSKDDAKAAIEYAHFYGKKAFMTVNTLLKNMELDEAFYEYISFYVNAGVDGFIIQDLGVFSFIKRFFPSVELHASTQMTISSVNGAKLLEAMGAKRIVTSRELSLNEIRAIRDACPKLEIESFCHGALCVCYSGQCLMSSFMGGRSGNRGRCAGTCRLPFDVLDENKRRLNAAPYPLSMKDFCTIERLPQMIEAGVNSFKIEGRMKQTSYAAGVVRIYRKYLDQCINGDFKGVSKADINELLELGSRDGFTDLYLDERNGKGLMTTGDSSHRRSDEVFVEPLRKRFPIDITLRANVGEPLYLSMTDGDFTQDVFGPTVEEAKKIATSKDDVIKHLLKLGESGFEACDVSIHLGENAFVPASIINKLRRECTEALSAHRIGERCIEVVPYTKRPILGHRNSTDIENLYVSVNEKHQLDVVLKDAAVKHIIIPLSLYDKNLKTDKELIIKLFPIIRTDKIVLPQDFNGRYMVSSVDGIGFLKENKIALDRVIADYRLYSFNNEAIAALEEIGIKTHNASVELSSGEIKHLDSDDKLFLIYGQLPLMYTANCIHKNILGCDKKCSTSYLKDRKGELLPVKCDCEHCTNIIYNCKKSNLISELNSSVKELRAAGVRIDFALESEKEVVRVLSDYKAAISGVKFELRTDETKGHYKKGVM